MLSHLYNKKVLVITIFVVLLVTIYTVTYLFNISHLGNLVLVQSSRRLISHYDFMIIKNGQTIVVDRGGNSRTFFDDRKAFDYVLRNNPKNIVLVGNFIVNNTEPLVLKDIAVELRGSFKAMYKDRTLLVLKDNVRLLGGIYDGNRGSDLDTSDSPIRVIQVIGNNVLLEDITVINGYSRGIEVSGIGEYGINVNIVNVRVENSWRNIMLWSNDTRIMRGYKLVNVFTRNSRGGCGIDIGTVNGIEILNVYSSEDDPAPVCVDSSKNVYINNLISLFRGLLIVHNYYEQTYNLVLSNGVSSGSYGCVLINVNGDSNISDIYLINIRCEFNNDDAIVIKRSGGKGFVDNLTLSHSSIRFTRENKNSIKIYDGLNRMYIVRSYLDKPIHDPNKSVIIDELSYVGS